MSRVEELVANFDLVPHPEGGFYKETYRSDVVLPRTGLPDVFRGDRSVSTLIYYLLNDDNFSALHRIKSDESWHFYEGSTLIVTEITPSGNLIEHRLGNNLKDGDRYQLVIKAGSWFGARLAEPNTYCLVGCGVAPGFDFEDFDLATREGLLKSFPQHAEVIQRLTR